MHHSYLPLFKTLGLNRDEMIVNVTVGVQKPDAVDVESVRNQFPYGVVSVQFVKGGLDVPDEDGGNVVIVASAGVEARFNIQERTVSIVGRKLI